MRPVRHALTGATVRWQAPDPATFAASLKTLDDLMCVAPPPEAWTDNGAMRAWIDAEHDAHDGPEHELIVTYPEPGSDEEVLIRTPFDGAHVAWRHATREWTVEIHELAEYAAQRLVDFAKTMPQHAVVAIPGPAP